MASPDQARVCTACGRPAHARGWCVTHYARWRRGGDPQVDTPIRAPQPSTYWAVHERIRADRGPASGHDCADCAGPATDWSYDGTDPDEKVDPARGYRYSTDVARYVPRCRSCHRRATRRGRQPLDAARCAALYHDGRTLAALAQLTGHSTAEIRRALVANGTPIRHARRRPRRTHLQNQHYRPS
jgi:hypothetical protein